MKMKLLVLFLASVCFQDAYAGDVYKCENKDGEAVYGKNYQFGSTCTLVTTMPPSESWEMLSNAKDVKFWVHKKIRRQGNKVMVWSMFNYTNPKQMEIVNRSYMSTKAFNTIDCVNWKAVTESLSFFTEQDGSGDTIWSDNAPSESRIVPDSYYESLAEYACNKVPAPKPKEK